MPRINALVRAWALLAVLFFVQGCAVIRPSEVLPEYKNKPFVDRVYPAPERFMALDAINGAKVCYVEKGSGPTLLILPGLSLGAHNWRFNFDRYAEKFHVVLMDFPGYGKSDAPDLDYSIELFKNCALEFMKKKGIKHAAILGHSLGGQVGIVLAAEYPKKVDALILETATGLRQRLGFIEDWAVTAYITADRFANLPEKKMRDYTEMNFYAPSAAQEELNEYQLSFRAHFWDKPIFWQRNEAFTRGALRIIMTDVRGYVASIQAPTLIMWGRQDRLDSVNHAYWLYQTIPNAQLYVIERCGHQPHLEKPEIYDFAVIKFLEALP